MLHISQQKNKLNVYQAIVIAVSGLVFSSNSIDTKPLQAATITNNFTVDVTSGTLVGQTGSGSFSYDDSALAGSGLETVTIQSLTFNFLGNIYTQNDDYFREYRFPALDLNNGSLVGLNYTVNYDPAKGSFFSISGALNLYGVIGGATFYEGVPDDNFNLKDAGTITYIATKPVPEPSYTLGTLALGVLGANLLMLRKQKSRKHTD